MSDEETKAEQEIQPILQNPKENDSSSSTASSNSRRSRALKVPKKDSSEQIADYFRFDVLFMKDLQSIKISRVDAVFLLANTMIGAGVLQQAQVFQESGIITAVVLFVIVSYFTFLGVRTLASLADVTGCVEYAEIAYRAYGIRAAVLIDICIVLFNFTTVISYIMYMGALTRDIILSYYPDDKQFYTTRSFYSCVFTAFVVFPICLVRNFGHLTIVAYFSILMMSMVTLVICIDGPIEYSSVGVGKIRWFSFSGSVLAMSNLIYSLGFSPAVLYTYGALDTKYKKDMNRIVLVAVLIGTAMCFMIGLTGYLLFRDSTNANILENFSGTIARICDVGMITHFALFLPSDFFILRASFYHLTNYTYREWNNVISTSWNPFGICQTENADSRGNQEDQPLSDNNQGAETENVLQNEDNSRTTGSNSSTNNNRAEDALNQLLQTSKKTDGTTNNGTPVDQDSNSLNSNASSTVVTQDFKKYFPVHNIQELDDSSYILYTLVTLSIITGTACVVDVYLGIDNDYYKFTINLVGGLAGSIDTFIMPGLCGMVLLSHNRKKYLSSVSLLIFGIVCTVVIIIGSFLMI
jgi:amino acid permease